MSNKYRDKGYRPKGYRVASPFEIRYETKTEVLDITFASGGFVSYVFNEEGRQGNRLPPRLGG